MRLAETDETHGQTGGIVLNELTINKLGRQWRAVGIYGQKIKFFYSGGESEKSLYPDRLMMVKTERKVSARKYYEEFLYSEAGSLMFYFQRSEGDDDAPAERRVYFSGSKAIRIIEDGKTRERLTATDNAVSKQISSASNKLSELFKRSIDL